MKKSLWIILTVSFAAFGAPNASSQTYDYTLSGVDTGSIDITVSGTNITAVTGKFDGESILELLPAGSIGDNNNVYDPSTILTYPGISFSLFAPDEYGNSYINLYLYDTSLDPILYQDVQGTCGATFAECPPAGFGPDSPEYLTAVTPEPGTAFLWLTGIGSMIVMMRRRIAQCLYGPVGSLD